VRQERKGLCVIATSVQFSLDAVEGVTGDRPGTVHALRGMCEPLSTVGGSDWQ
jgi:hypothetical protein